MTITITGLRMLCQAYEADGHGDKKACFDVSELEGHIWAFINPDRVPLIDEPHQEVEFMLMDREAE